MHSRFLILTLPMAWPAAKQRNSCGLAKAACITQKRFVPSCDCSGGLGAVLSSEQVQEGGVKRPLASLGQAELLACPEPFQALRG